MPNNYFVSGMPKSGKTTLLRKLVEKMRERGLRVGGFLSPDQKSHGARTGFAVEDIETGRKAVFAGIAIDGPKVSKYHVDIRSFEGVIVPILRKMDRYDVVVIDEIGSMEMKSMKFGELLADLLESDTPLVASLDRRYIEDYGAWGEVQLLTPSNRGELYLNLLSKVIEYHRKKPREEAVAKPAKKTAAVKAPKKKAGKKAARKKEAKKAGKKKQKAGKKPKEKKQKKKREDLEKMAEDIFSHHRKSEHKHHGNQEKKEEKEVEVTKEESKEEKKEEKEEERKRSVFHDWVKEHIGV